MTALQLRGLPPGHRLLTPQDQGGLSRLDYSTRRRLVHRSGQPSLQPTALTWGAHIRQAGSRRRCLRRKTGPTGATLGSGQSAAGHGVFGRCFGATEHRGVTRARPTGRATWRPTTCHGWESPRPGGSTDLGRSAFGTSPAGGPAVSALSVVTPLVMEAAGRRRQEGS